MAFKMKNTAYYKKKFAFQKWHHFDNRLWNEIVKEVRSKIVHDRFPIIGYDNISANITLYMEPYDE